MKNISFIVALILLGSVKSRAESQSIGYTLEQKQQIALAIDVLVQAGVLKTDETKCVQIQEGLLEELRGAGLLKSGGAQLSSICPDAAK